MSSQTPPPPPPPPPGPPSAPPPPPEPTDVGATAEPATGTTSGGTGKKAIIGGIAAAVVLGGGYGAYAVYDKLDGGGAQPHDVMPASTQMYARVDLVGPEDAPLLIELELVEPELFLDLAPGSADRFAAALLARA